MQKERQKIIQKAKAHFALLDPDGISISEAFIFGLTLFPVIPAQPFELCEIAHHSDFENPVQGKKEAEKLLNQSSAYFNWLFCYLYPLLKKCNSSNFYANQEVWFFHLLNC